MPIVFMLGGTPENPHAYVRSNAPTRKNDRVEVDIDSCIEAVRAFPQAYEFRSKNLDVLEAVYKRVNYQTFKASRTIR